ncbi:uncharacterized protein [Diadema antillarum]|uniref:uncharacterized protein n=1 Tax=Diadema antillarum TaxID=105358 RepID=UPI003A86F4FC
MARWCTSPAGRQTHLSDNFKWLLIILFVVLARIASVTSYSDYFQENRSEDSFGRQFYIVLPVENSTRIRMVHNLRISSRSRDTVTVNVTRPGSSWAGKSVDIQAHIAGNITLDMAGPIRYPYNPNGITVQVKADDAISVWVVPGRGDFILDGYRAIPQEALGKNYASVLYPGAGGYTSEIVLFSPYDLSNNIYLAHARVNMTVTIDNKTSLLPSFINLPKMDSAKIASLSDLSGMGFVADEPISVVSMRMCRQTAPNPGPASQSCNSLIEEVPPLGAWGRSFVILPQVSPAPAKMQIRVVSGLNNTVVSILRPSGVLYQTWNMSDENIVKDVNVSSGVPLTLRSNKPILVTQFFTSGRKRLDYGAMLNVPPVEQFTNQTVVFPALNDTLFRNTLILITRCEHRKDITLDGEDITGQYQHSVVFTQELNHTVHGTYCTLNTTVKAGSHTLQLRKNANIGTAYSAILYGSAADQAYAYPVAADMREIVCNLVKRFDIELCDYYVPPDYIYSTSTSVPLGTSAPKSNGAPDHSVAIIVVLVVLSSLAALIVVVIVIGRCGRTKDGSRVTWSRLQNTGDIHYDVSIDGDDDVPMDSV